MPRLEFAGSAIPFSDKIDATVAFKQYRRGGHFDIAIPTPPDPTAVNLPKAIHVCILDAAPDPATTAEQVYNTNIGRGTYTVPDSNFPGDITIDVTPPVGRKFAQIVVEYPDGV